MTGTELLELVNLDPKQYRGRIRPSFPVDSNNAIGLPAHWLLGRRLCCWMSHFGPLMRSIGPTAGRIDENP